MSLPAPAWTTDENVRFDGTTSKAILIKTEGTTRHLILWEGMTEQDQQRWIDLIDLYGGALPIPATPATAGEQTVGFGGTVVGGNATGLANDATVYTATITVDGTPNPVSVVGSAAQTFTTLVSEIGLDLSGATIAIDGGDIKVTSSSTGVTSTISISDIDLFSSSTGFVSINAAVPGTDAFSDDLETLMNNVKVDNGTTYYFMFVPMIEQIGAKPTAGRGVQYNGHDAYYDGTAWVKLADDTAV